MPLPRKGWSTSKGTLGQPRKMGPSPSQGITSNYRGVVQGKFTGEDKFAYNMKKATPQMPGSKAWPNKGTVLRGRPNYGPTRR